MNTLTVGDVANICERYTQLLQTKSSSSSENPELTALEEEWARRAPRSADLAVVADISNKSPDPQGYWRQLLRQNGYTIHGFQSPNIEAFIGPLFVPKGFNVRRNSPNSRARR